MRASLGWAMVVVMLLLAAPAARTNEGTVERQGLVLMSYDAEDTWSQSILHGLAEALDGLTLARHVEYLDARQHNDQGYYSLQHH